MVKIISKKVFLKKIWFLLLRNFILYIYIYIFLKFSRYQSTIFIHGGSEFKIFKPWKIQWIKNIMDQSLNFFSNSDPLYFSRLSGFEKFQTPIHYTKKSDWSLKNFKLRPIILSEFENFQTLIHYTKNQIRI